MTDYNILHKQVNDWLKTEIVEEKYGVQYIADFSVADKNGNWANYPVSIFYQPDPPQPEYSNYMGVFLCPIRGHVYVCDGITAAEHTWTGMLLENGKDIIYSKYRWDYVTGENGEMVDGGPEYTKCSFSKNSRLVNINIFEGQLIISEKQ